MPVSRRDKKVSLTKTLKKGMKLKQQIVEDIRKSLDDFNNLFVFNICNMRHGPMNQLREEWKGSRFFLAKRKVMAIALGRTQESEVQKNLHKVAAHVVGECGLLFTNKPKDEVVRWFENYSKMDFAKSGFVAKETVTLSAGALTDFSFSMEPQLRALGLPTQLEKGIIVLREDYVVCRAGTPLSPEQAQLLKLIGKPMAEFRITLLCMWTKGDGSFERIKIGLPHEQKKNTTSKLLEKSHKKIDASKKQNESSINLTELCEKLEETTKQQSESGVNKSPYQVKKSTGHSIKSFLEETAAKTETDSLMEEEESPSDKHNLEKSHLKQSSMTPMQTPKKAIKTPKIMVTQDSVISKSTAIQVKKSREIKKNEKSKSEETFENKSEEETMEVEPSSKLEVGTPRRSMRTPKPIKRTPEQKKLSVKKLTESSKKFTPKQTKRTPKRQV